MSEVQGRSECVPFECPDFFGQVGVGRLRRYYPLRQHQRKIKTLPPVKKGAPGFGLCAAVLRIGERCEAGVIGGIRVGRI